MFSTKLLMEVLPNIHPLGMLTMAYTVVYRKKALIPIYIYILLNGIFAGFAPWWVPYLYIWAILWGITMLIPKKLPRWAKAILYPTVCCLFGLFFGVLYAPGQALLYGLTFDQMLLWIAAGVSFDLLHFIGNLFAGLLVLPISELLCKLSKKVL